MDQKGDKALKEFREINFLNKFDIPKRGTISQNGGQCVYDVTGDGKPEFIYGTLQGKLHVFSASKNIYSCSNLGTISCLTCGELCGIPTLVVVNCEGEIHFFNFTREITRDLSNSVSMSFNGEGINNVFKRVIKGNSSSPFLKSNSSSMLNVSSLESFSSANLEEKNGETRKEVRKKNDNKGRIKQFLSQRIILNCSTVLIMDINCDGKNEIVLGTSSRMIYVYSLDLNFMNMSKSEFQQTISLTLKNKIFSLKKHGENLLLVGYFYGGGCVIAKKKVFGRWKELKRRRKPLGKYHVVYYHVDDYVPCIFDGDVSFYDENSKYFLLFALLNGKIRICDLRKSGEGYVWSHDFGKEIVALGRGHFSKSKKEEMCFTTWEGKTYIFNEKKERVYLNLQQNIESFECGKYAALGGTSLCLFYSTVNQKMLCFEKVDIQSIKLLRMNLLMKDNPTFQKMTRNDKDEGKSFVNSVLYSCTEEELDEYISYLKNIKN